LALKQLTNLVTNKIIHPARCDVPQSVPPS
ncbi:unnamed protein product, partial [marine sediment metagenome]